MNSSIPLGQAESERLEFKSKDALRNLFNISREVVAMLNASGGDIWIGLAEEQGRAVRTENVEHPSREATRIRNHLTDAIEPPLISEEFEIDPIAIQGHGEVLRVRVKPIQNRRPYALREGTARHYIRRVQDRVRPMSFDEIRSEVIQSKPARDTELEAATKELLEARARQQSKSVFWMRIQPIGNYTLKLSGDEYRGYFIDHRKTENRASGWNFVSFDAPKQTPKEITHGQDGEAFVRILRNGAIEFTMPLINLYWKSTGWAGEAHQQEIWPYALLEFPASIFRLAKTIYREHEFTLDAVLADLALFGVHDWTLRPHSPATFGYKMARPEPFKGKEIMAEPHKFLVQEIEKEPDRCAFRLVQRVYEEFDYFEDKMPSEFDRESGRLILPGA